MLFLIKTIYRWANIALDDIVYWHLTYNNLILIPYYDFYKWLEMFRMFGD